MPDMLAITKTPGKVTILHLAGQLDGQTRDLLLDAARGEQEAGARFVLLDLQGVDVISSAGMGALHTIYKMFTPREEIEAWEKEKHGEPYKTPYFKLAGASANVHYVLNIAGFLSNIPVYPDLSGALESFPA